jgi:hypothetical protein
LTWELTMNPAALHAAVRRFPLLGRPRPACPALPDRVAEIAATAHQHATDGMAEAAHALNKAALIASDCGLPHLARTWSWRHINLYRKLDRLTVPQASYLLEPVLNLARLQIRAQDGQPARQLLHAMYQAVTTTTDLIVDSHTLPLANLTGTRDDLRQLHQWTWLQYLSEGIRTLALTGRWDDAVAHATALNGIGLHLMDGRQAAIIAHCLHHQPDAARALLHDSSTTEPWEQQVAACLAVICAEPQHLDATITTMIDQFLAHEPIPGYAVFRARLGLTVAHLASEHDHNRAQHLLRRTATEAINADDGYAARDILGHRTTLQLHDRQREDLAGIVAGAGLGARALPVPERESLTESVGIAEQVLAAVVGVRESAPA